MRLRGTSNSVSMLRNVKRRDAFTSVVSANWSEGVATNAVDPSSAGAAEGRRRSGFAIAIDARISVVVRVSGW